MTTPTPQDDRMCDQYPECGLTQWSCNLLQDLVYEEDAALICEALRQGGAPKKDKL